MRKTGEQAINTKNIKDGRRYHDTPVGVLCLNSSFPKPKGHVRNPETFDFPVICKVIDEVDIPTLLFNPTPELIRPFIEGAQQLEKDGVKAITGSCGFLARFQSQLAEAVNIPVFTSSIVQAFMVRLMHGAHARIGILTASAAALTLDHFVQCGTRIEDFVIRGMEGYPEFWETIIEGKRNYFDMVKLESEIIDSATTVATENNLDALILECTDLSAFSKPIQEAITIPVYDINSLVEYAAFSVCRKNYA
ncbi:aspartate/glutamate racemase family protein [Desulforhopalus singaporensis]|uniref:Aspartate/glutamate racemase family protein n=1 Tax=Desulforhopalus singaporensis TaxID=91360 RepID=A0A1H0PKM9_9BACT|nr:hypothetical protein [Desulforhopalus singaporensis]SDP05156.1 hypothetical protein SAMN05660330_01698 [Desulforhopalus singaporensis]